MISQDLKTLKTEFNNLFSPIKTAAIDKWRSDPSYKSVADAGVRVLAERNEQLPFDIYECYTSDDMILYKISMPNKSKKYSVNDLLSREDYLLYGDALMHVWQA